MGAVEYTPGSHNDTDWSERMVIGIGALCITVMLGLLVWSLFTPHTDNPHAGQVCVRDTQRLLPYTSTDMWGNTTTQLMNQTQCLEWQEVQHQ